MEKVVKVATAKDFTPKNIFLRLLKISSPGRYQFDFHTGWEFGDRFFAEKSNETFLVQSTLNVYLKPNYRKDFG